MADINWTVFTFIKMEQIEQFFNAIRKGSLQDVTELVRRYPKLLKSRDQRGSTPLVLATYYNHLELVKFLLGQGADANEKDSSGNTALMGVCFKGYEDIAKLLIENGAEVNQTNAMGASSLIYAATFNQLGIAKLLLNHNANIHYKDKKGQTAMDQAKAQGFEPMIELLKNYGSK